MRKKVKNRIRGLIEKEYLKRFTELRPKKSEKYKFRKFEGITLISLVITIIVLIILASVTIYLSLENNGIFNRTKEVKELTNKQTATEIINLKITNCQMNKYAEKQEMLTLKELSLILKEDDEIKYVTETSQIGSAEYKVGDSPTSIYTKLNEYPYEFEINGQLQLASIDGVTIATTNDKKANGIDLLWTNDNPNVSFPAQTINIDLSNYEAVLIFAKPLVSAPASTLTEARCAAYAYAKVGESTLCTGIEKGSAGWCGEYRKANIKADGVEFETGRYGQKSYEYTDNNTIIPLYIWGVKKDIYENLNL